METPNPSSPAHRTKAYRLRKMVEKGESVSTDDAEWLASYDVAIKSRAAGDSMGGSRHSKTVHVEESAEAVGFGEAAATAASAALAREEGRRLDSMMTAVINATATACGMYQKLCESSMGIMERMMQRTEKMEEVHMSMLETVRVHYLRTVEAEGEAMQAQMQLPQDEPDTIAEVATAIAGGMGIKLPGAETPSEK